MEHSVTIHIVPNDDGSFMVSGSATRRGVGALNIRHFQNDVALRDFLSGQLGVREEPLKAALKGSQKGAYSLPHVMLTEERVKELGLGPI